MAVHVPFTSAPNLDPGLAGLAAAGNPRARLWRARARSKGKASDDNQKTPMAS